ncbi:MAG: hypothetical protein U5L04_11750 [Trueperaceae bacterium]|nr:hypothetical protein [Trueperaceae bacterium]
MNRSEPFWHCIPPLFRVLAGVALVVAALVARTWFAVLVGMVGVVLVIAGYRGFAALWRRRDRQQQTGTVEHDE